MKHLTEEQLILFYYGETDDAQAVAKHLESCLECRAGLENLRHTLGSLAVAPVPERGHNYGREVWRRLQRKLKAVEQPACRRPILAAWLDLNFALLTFALRRWLAAGGVVLLVGAAFLAGRFEARTMARLERPGTAVRGPALPRPWNSWRELGDHLERSQLALIELVNSKADGLVDITAEKVLARELVDVNRLYCQTAVGLHDDGMLGVLGDLERTLLEISNSPSQLSSAQLAELRRRIDDEGILFKVKVVSFQVRARERKSATEFAGGRS